MTFGCEYKIRRDFFEILTDVYSHSTRNVSLKYMRGRNYPNSPRIFCIMGY